MKIELNILNKQVVESSGMDNKIDSATWHSRKKTYETDSFVSMDDDIKNSTIGHKLDRLILNDIQITSKYGVTELIEFLENAKLSFEH